MLRLTFMARGSAEVILAVDGWIEGEDVDLLEREGERWLQQVQHLVLILDGVRFIDQAGIALFQRWAAKDRLVLHGGALFIQTLLMAHGLMLETAESANE